MYRFILIALLTLTANAGEVDSTANKLMEKLADKMVGKLVDKLLDLGSPFQNDFAFPASPIAHGASSAPDGEEVIIIEEPTDDDTLAYALGLRGGATPMKAMKSPMKAMKSPMKAMKSPMKGMKAMNEYFTKMAEARKTGAKSFEHNGKTYVATKAKTGMILYKAK